MLDAGLAPSPHPSPDGRGSKDDDDDWSNPLPPAESSKGREGKGEGEGLGEHYTYDLVGNRLTGPTKDIRYIYGQNNQLASKTTPSTRTDYRYDRNGSLTGTTVSNHGSHKTTTSSYGYDYDGELVSVRIDVTDGKKIKSRIVNYAYDPFGRRIGKSIVRDDLDDDDDLGGTRSRASACSNGRDGARPSIVTYVYDRGAIVAEYDGSGFQTARYVASPLIDEPLAMVKYSKPKSLFSRQPSSSTTYYYHADHLGSVVALTDSKGQIVQTYSYDSFGNTTATNDDIAQPYGYTSREWDRETGLYYYRARYYDPSIGRFLSRDPIGLMIGRNQYIYAGANPVGSIDPSGLASLNDCLRSVLSGYFDSGWLGGQTIDYNASASPWYFFGANPGEPGYFNPFTGDVNIVNDNFDNRDLNASDIALMAHELKHSQQYDIAMTGLVASLDISIALTVIGSPLVAALVSGGYATIVGGALIIDTLAYSHDDRFYEKGPISFQNLVQSDLELKYPDDICPKGCKLANP